jgi:hypothetical protein
MNSKKFLVVVSLFLGTGLVAVYAQALDPDTVLQKVIDEIFSPLYKVIVGAAFVYFLYGGAKFVRDLNHPEEKNTGKQHLLWGSIGLFIIFSVGGILGIFSDIFGGLGF